MGCWKTELRSILLRMQVGCVGGVDLEARGWELVTSNWQLEADYQVLITSYSLLIRAGTLVYRQGVRSVICVEGKSLACPALGGLAHGG